MKLANFFAVIALALSAISVQAQAPAFTDGPPSSLAGLNAAYSFTYTATGTSPIVYSVSSGLLPTGLSINSAGVGVISGTPTTTGTFTGTVTASNGVSPAATQNFSIVVSTTLLNTVPEGAVNVTFPAATTTYLSVPLTSDPSYRGVVSSVTATTIAVADSPAPWASGALANLNFVKFLSGNETGRVVLISANATNSLTLDTTDNNNGATVSLATTGFNVLAGDAFEIFPADTLGSVFGSSAGQLILTGGIAYADADVVNIYSPTLKKFQNYFFNTTAGYWELKGSTVNANNTILYPYGALAVFRRVNTALSFSMTGRVPEVPVLTKVGPDTTIYGSSGYPVPLTLAQLDLGSSWLTSNSYNSADILSLYSPTLKKLVNYFQLPASTSWRTKTSATDVSETTTINPGDLVVLFQRGNVSGVESFLSPAMPYTIDDYTNF